MHTNTGQRQFKDKTNNEARRHRTSMRFVARGSDIRESKWNSTFWSTIRVKTTTFNICIHRGGFICHTQTKCWILGNPYLSIYRNFFLHYYNIYTSYIECSILAIAWYCSRPLILSLSVLLLLFRQLLLLLVAVCRPQLPPSASLLLNCLRHGYSLHSDVALLAVYFCCMHFFGSFG